MSNNLAVIISIYKNDNIINVKECFYSLMNQTYIKFDIFVKFDGPVSLEIDYFLTKLVSPPNINLFIHKRELNIGLDRSLNELLKVVLKNQYSFIARMDADDICKLERFEKQIFYLENKEEIDVLGSYVEEFYDDGTTKIIKYPIDHYNMLHSFGKKNPLAHPSVMFRTRFFKKAGNYPENTIKDEDTMLWLNGFLHGCRFANLDEILLSFRVTNDFYKRRNGLKKSYGDLKNRCKIINLLNLSKTNYIFALSKFILLSLPFPKLTNLLYKKLR